jgi:NAD(P)-dependent dehydrogenase (short-subunit alcohol dehydrogenase family)
MRSADAGEMKTDRLALVTGTSAGLGAAVAAGLLASGWAVVGVARRTNAAADPRYRHLSLDLADSFSVAKIESELAPPGVPAAEIVRFIETDGHPLFSEARLEIRRV